MPEQSSTGEKTEKATPKRRRDAREEGQVRKSMEVITAVMLLSIFGSLKIFGPYMVGKIGDFMKLFFGTTMYTTNMDAAGFTKVVLEMVWSFAMVLAPVLLVAMIAALGVNWLQIGFLFSSKALKPKFSRLNPIEGIKRMFSIQTVYELFKSIGKFIIIGILTYWQIVKNMQEYLHTTDQGAMQASIVIFNTVINTAFLIGAALAVFSIIDYVYQWFKYEKDLKMTKYEVKMEYKQMEGNPEIKQKIKQKQRQMASARMMQSVPDADVVITNPTHVAVAIRYDQETQGGAPVILAKGLDLIAQRIKEIANDHKVEIVENKEVARALYSQCEIGDQIPGELYGAVAEILAYVYKMKNGGQK